MKIKALVSFSGQLTMAKGEVREYDNNAVLSDLLRAGYIAEVAEEEAGKAPEKKPAPVPKKKTVKTGGSK